MRVSETSTILIKQLTHGRYYKGFLKKYSKSPLSPALCQITSPYAPEDRGSYGTWFSQSNVVKWGTSRQQLSEVVCILPALSSCLGHEKFTRVRSLCQSSSLSDYDKWSLNCLDLPGDHSKIFPDEAGFPVWNGTNMKSTVQERFGLDACFCHLLTRWSRVTITDSL